MTDDYTEYEAEWEDLSEKVILVQILAEQQRTNRLLEQLTDAPDASNDDATPMYRCDYCGETVREDDRQRHADGQHNTPPGAWERAFERVA